MSKRKRPGRPPLDPDDILCSVSVRLPSRIYDAFCRLALRQSVSVAEVLRQELRRRPFDDDGDEK